MAGERNGSSDMQQAEDFFAESGSLRELLGGLEETDFRRATAFKG